jgi:hypothetical protein
MKWLWIVFLVVIGIFLIVGAVLGMITFNQCKNACEKEGALTFQRVQNGDWNLNDYCICFFDNRIESFQLGGSR